MLFGRFLGEKDEPAHHDMKPEEMAAALQRANTLIEKYVPKGTPANDGMKPAMAAE